MSTNSYYQEGGHMPEATIGPREMFEHMQRVWLGETDDDPDLLADDAVIETPFAPPGRPHRIEGRDAILAHYGPQRAAFPVRLEEVRNVVVHDTADPEVIVVEYELTGVAPTGLRGSAPFIGVLRVTDGKTTLWREYQNVPAIAAATGHLPDLLAGYEAQRA